MMKKFIIVFIGILLSGCLSDDYYVDMVDVDGGELIMGSDEEDADEDEKPLHTIYVESFRIGRYEVTQKLWNLIMNDKNPSVFKGDDKPVECVSWYDVQIFIERLNNITGHSYRLPTEAEWEYAAKGGNLTPKNRSDGEVPEISGWFIENSDSTTHNVGQLAPNVLGIYDMTGNVHEWCNDFYDSLSYSRTDCFQPAKGYDIRVYRGGSWASSRQYCRIANRNKNSAELRHYCLGFRLAEDMD